jgi:FkbM family methyltransferase
MSGNLHESINTFLSFYAANKHLAELDEITNFLFSNVLSAKGYNNFRNAQESGESYFIYDVLKKSDIKVCIDIGANIGGYSRLILDATGADVIAFEPLPDVYKTLKSNLINFSPRITLNNMGVGSKNETLAIRYNPNTTEHATFSMEVDEIPYLNNNREISVPVVSLDSYIQSSDISRTDLIKIDVEGFEAEVLSGACETLGRFRPRFIQVEFNWHQLFKGSSLYILYKKLVGYQVYQLRPNRWVIRHPKDQSTNMYFYPNFVFVRDY